MPASHRRTHSAPPHAYRLSITAALSQCAPLSVPGPGAQIDSAGPANRAAPPPADDGGTDSDDDSIFSEAEGPCSSAAHALIRELELSLAALANANADLRFRVSLLRALVRRLARDVRTLVDEKRASASVTHSTPTEMPHARSPETHSSAGSRDLVHLAAALHASGFSDSHEGEDDPMAPHSPHVSAHSRSSSELHPAAESRSFSSFAPPTPTSAKYVPLGMSPPHILDASSMSGHSSAHSSHIALAPPPPRSQMKTPRQSMLAPAAPELKPSSREHKRSSRATVLSFLPSRNSSVRAATNQLSKPEPARPRPSLQIRPSLNIPGIPSPLTSPVATTAPRASLDSRTRIPTFTRISSSAKKLRDTLRRRSSRIPQPPPPPSSSAH